MNNLRNMLYIFRDNWLKQDDPEKYEKKLNDYYNSDLHDAIRENAEWFANNAKLVNSQEINYVLSIYSIKAKGMNLDEIMDLDYKFNKSATGLYGLMFDNRAKIKLSDMYGYLFSLMVSEHNDNYDFTLWDVTGTNHLVTINTKYNSLTDEEIEKIEKAMENHRNGIVNCSDCKREMKVSDIAGQYFASRFCKECWDGKWMEVEARENYN